MKNLRHKVLLLLLTTAIAFSVSFYALGSDKSPVRSGVVKRKLSRRANKQKTLEIVFVIDTTGSMGGLIDGAKQKIWSIVNDVMQRKDHPQVKVGLVAYRDNGDAYVTQTTGLTADLDKIYTTLMEFRAEGGGDLPENVQRGLADGVEKAGWSKAGAEVAQVIFLIGDAPSKKYAQEPDVLETTARAIKQNIIVNTIQCGNEAETRNVWQLIAQRGEGKYFAIAQNGGVTTIETPFDAPLAQLAAKMGTTYVAYAIAGLPINGRNMSDLALVKQREVESVVAAEVPLAAQADRAVNKAINSRAYTNDLLAAIESGTLKIEDVKKTDLPTDLQKLSASELKTTLEQKLAERKTVRAEILDLSKKRDAFIQIEKSKTGTADGFDKAVSDALIEQMRRRGIN